MKKLLFALVGLMLLFASCEKENNDPVNTKGTARFTCLSDNPYYCYIDNTYMGNVNGNSFIEYSVEQGFHSFKAIQISGYLFIPSEFTVTKTITPNMEFEFVFP